MVNLVFGIVFMLITYAITVYIYAGLHAICTAVAGRGLTTAMATGRRRHGVLGVVAGFALHFAWNADWPQSWAPCIPLQKVNRQFLLRPHHELG